MSLSYVRSVLAPEAVGRLVAERYGVSVTGCELVRSLVNDVYAVDSANGRCALKLYRQVAAPRARSLDEVRWEQDLAEELLRAGLRVPAPVPDVDGELVGQLSAPEGRRPYALTRWIDGAKPAPPLTDDLYRAFGTLTARFHTVAEAMGGRGHRHPVDPVEELPATAAQVAGVLSDEGDRELVLAAARTAGRTLAGPLAAGMTWGIRHGDVTLDNVHLTRNGLALHDFDRSGPGWLAADLTGVRGTDHWAAFQAGYGESRTLTSADLESLPALRVVGLIGNLRFHLIDKPLVFGTESRGEGWVQRELASLRELASD